ncbi:hypothetical protein L228DRAFT_245862 [Xylona heveae TC161]|uniref:SYO1-like TPR repeats domain-containing protein n=1 Tax=Xylona heveae (strain CBS 132557 / TC161) TaxID=1328760 RepID=A0A165H8K1_XYLHT|nr:hypothetical protein L228DRAFT_245862 [Xylona heveae TC161]KZF23135.1 hypothetical protein L228DRAFT_245862 [Xylona heveae TC161]
MGKARRSQKPKDRRGPTSGRPLKPLADPESVKLRDQEILPAVSALASTQPHDRVTAATVICNLIENEKCRKLLLREQLVRLVMEQTINDADLSVITAGWGVLRNLALAESWDFGIHLYRQDILTPLQAAIKKVSDFFRAPESGFASLPKAQQVLVWELADSLNSIMSSLSETNDDIVSALSNLSTVPDFQLGLASLAEAPSRVVRNALQCVYDLSVDNDDLLRQIAARSVWLDVLKANAKKTGGECVAACGVLHNLSLAEQAEKLKDAELIDSIPPKDMLSAITRSYRALVETFSQEDDTTPDQIETVKMALETIASISAVIGSQAEQFSELDESSAAMMTEEQYATSGDEEEDEDDDVEDGDRAKEMEGMSDDEDDDDSDINSEIKEDMDMVTGEDQDGEQRDSWALVAENAEKGVQYLIEDTIPSILPLAKVSSQPSKPNDLIEKSLDCLNNITWAVGAVVPLSSDSPLRPAWAALAQQLWSECVVPVVASQTADISLAESVTSLAWAISRSLRGQLDFAGDEHRKFMALYEAAGQMKKNRSQRSAPVKRRGGEETEPLDEICPKCIGLLGSLAQCPGRVDVNREIGAFLVSRISLIPETAVEDAIEALNQIFDIYADKGYDYDQAVFWKDGFLGHLEASLPKVRKLAKAVDKRKDPGLRAQADEAATNLARFIRYKKEERR